ncbi:MAG TPA: dihydroneopterin aldolase [Flavobacteriales bacterium]|nr:dihydroneopterin aldolase [Flavobacteriales bacterium]
MTTNKILVNGLRFWAHHGCMEEEAIVGQEYRVDVALWVNLAPSAETDELSKTVDYEDVYRIVRREMGVRSKLVEQVCQRIVNALRNELPLSESVEVKVTKFQPPINGDCDHIAVVMQG